MHPYQQSLELAKLARDKQELKAVLQGLIAELVKQSQKQKTLARQQKQEIYAKSIASDDNGDVFASDISVSDTLVIEEIFTIFRDKIFTIFTQGDILDCSFLYLALIAPPNAPQDDRFLPFIISAQKLLATNPSQEEYIMLAELGAIAKVLAYPREQNLSFLQQLSINKDNDSKKHKKSSPKSSRESRAESTPLVNIAAHQNNGITFFLEQILCSSINGISAIRCSKFIVELFSLPRIGFSFVKDAIIIAFSRASTPLITRNICNWQLHILWNAKNLFNNRVWLELYEVWRDVFYNALDLLRRELDSAKACLHADSSDNQQTEYISQDASQYILARKNAESWLDIALYLQFFIYHICGNNFSSQAQWRKFNTEISAYAAPLYAEFARVFLDGLESSPSGDNSNGVDSSDLNVKHTRCFTTNAIATNLKDTKRNSRIVIGILRDRLVENSPFKVEYSFIKNLVENYEFNEQYEIKIYCMSLIEKSENNPEVIAKLSKLGVEIIDIGLMFNKAEFYNSHLQKALALRSVMRKDKVQLLISPNNGYGISDFLFASRCARVQAFWTHGNFVYDVSGIDARLTHICNNQQHITHEGFRFYGVPVKMDKSFYNPQVLQDKITQARKMYCKNFDYTKQASHITHTQTTHISTQFASHDTPHDKQAESNTSYLFGVIGRLTKIDSTSYLEAICALLERNPTWGFLACGIGNENEIKQKISRINPQLLSRFFFSGYVDSAVYGHILDFWADSFPMEQGESRIEYVAKGRGLSLRYYDMGADELESMLEAQLNANQKAIQEIIEAIIEDRKHANLVREKADFSSENSAVLHNALESTFFSDFASYKECVLGFVRETSAFSETEYVEKATHIMRLYELDSSAYARKVAIQSAIHAMNSEIKARLGVEYFLAFAREHLA